MEAGGIGVTNLPNQRYRSILKRTLNYNIMVVGGNGLGKTTFLNMLLDTSLIGKQDGNGITTAKGLLLENGVVDMSQRQGLASESGIEFLQTIVTVVERGFSMNLNIIEVDKIGNSTRNQNCWVPIERYIGKCYEEYMGSEKYTIKSRINDKRIHVCLYFCEPINTGFKCVDVAAMKRLSNICNLIPIVSKADLLNSAQIGKLDKLMRRTLQEEEIECFILKNAEEQDISGPFFTVCAIKNEAGEYMREYPWGTIYIETANTSDFYKIKEVLISRGYLELLEGTNAFYDRFKMGYYLKKMNFKGVNDGKQIEHEKNIVENVLKTFE